ncbi:MAG: hypothetical protein EOO88_53775 [Pedobacter sp.]|nr:MAG: hypothetical protein EOO88_53775 [Pedobacter sp.]
MLILLFFWNVGNSQQVVNITVENMGTVPNTYYKDVNNLLNNFVGTWNYYSGNAHLQLVIRKEVHLFDNDDNVYYDMLVGEYKYSVNNVEIVNTLSQLNNVNVQWYDHGLSGNLLLHYSPQPGTPLQVNIDFLDPQRDYLFSRCNLKINPSNLNIMEFFLARDISAVPVGSPTTFRIPHGTHILTKQ